MNANVKNTITILFIIIATISIATSVAIIKNKKNKHESTAIDVHKLNEEIEMPLHTSVYLENDIEINLNNYVEIKCSQTDDKEETKCDLDKELVYNFEFIYKKKKETFNLSSSKNKKEISNYIITLVDGNSHKAKIKVEEKEK